MDISREDLEIVFYNINDEELISRYSSGNLTELASKVALNEIRKRHLALPTISTQKNISDEKLLQENFVSVAHLLNPIDSVILQGYLEAEGLDAVVSGSRVLVPESQKIVATDTLVKFENSTLATDLNRQIPNINRDIVSTKNLKNASIQTLNNPFEKYLLAIIAILSLFFGIFMFVTYDKNQGIPNYGLLKTAEGKVTWIDLKRGATYFQLNNNELIYVYSPTSRKSSEVFHSLSSANNKIVKILYYPNPKMRYFSKEKRNDVFEISIENKYVRIYDNVIEGWQFNNMASIPAGIMLCLLSLLSAKLSIKEFNKPNLLLKRDGIVKLS